MKWYGVAALAIYFFMLVVSLVHEDEEVVQAGMGLLVGGVLIGLAWWA